MAKLAKSGLALALVVAALGCVGSAYAQDMVKVAPKNSKVLVDNDQIRAIEVTLKPGDKLPMHSHPAYLVYVITGGKIKTTTADGKVTDEERKAGEARWSDPVTHSNENTGTTTTKVLVVELKSAK